MSTRISGNASAIELKRFRELVVDSVMATNIVDKELRNGRWNKAFDKKHEESAREATNRKATIIIEHLIQASDVSHTMQHWHVCRKWNALFYRECYYRAFKNGRSENNPVGGWYKGEMGFFDFYIMLLARKLKDCGVFGKSSDEYLNYALANRKEWERRGEAVVDDMIRAFEKEESEK